MKKNEKIITFDLGGTWFRSGVSDSFGDIEYFEKQPSINYKTHGHLNDSELKKSLISYLLKMVSQLRNNFNLEEKPNTVVISLGASINGHNGRILNSGPLWGESCESFNLIDTLKDNNDNINWLLINDISAGLFWLIKSQQKKLKKIALLTLSTGVGCRTFDLEKNRIPLESTHGLQGEIGHIPINFSIGNKLIQSRCECGGMNHLNAFCSGRGIENILKYFSETYKEDYKNSLFNNKPLTFKLLIRSAQKNEIFSKKILKEITKPIAKMIITHLTLDPEVEKIILVGGVIESLNPYYYNALFKNLEELEMYQISKLDKNFFRKKIIFRKSNENINMKGAAWYANKKENIDIEKKENPLCIQE